MIESTLSKRYARALLELADQDGKAEAYLEGLKAFGELLESQKELGAALKNPFFEMGSRLRVIDAVTAKLGFDQRLTRFLQLLVKKGRLGVFADIWQAYQGLFYKRQGIVEAVVTTARKMPDSFYEQISKILGAKTGQKVMTRPQVNPQVLGGVAVKIGEKVYDGTVISDLGRLQSRLKSLPTL